MFRIRRIHDRTTRANKAAVRQVQDLLRDRFVDEREETILKIPRALGDPILRKYRSIIFIAEGSNGSFLGAAILLHFTDLRFCYLDYIATSNEKSGRGIGSALYERVRTEARALMCKWLFMEALQETPEAEPAPEIMKDNISRLRFYERYGTRPVINTKYETPLHAEDRNPPYLLFDDLGTGRRLRRNEARTIVRAILERKYRGLCPNDYVETVVSSFHDDPVRIREPRYIKVPHPVAPATEVPLDMRIPLIINDKHEIHHVHERGYVQSPVRIRSIMKGLDQSGLFEKVRVLKHPDREITSVHEKDFVNYLRTICEKLPEGRSVYPYVFPIRNKARPPRELLVRAGYYCIDTFTPLNRNAYLAARRAVDCALTGADRLLKGDMLSYALVRPPGHHAGRDYFGGFCYFNSAAIAANRLSREGKVAILDIDYHHGNGTQDIFYDRDDVLTLSIHCHPKFAYPYFTGFKEETGVGKGIGMNINHPLPEHLEPSRYIEALSSSLRSIKRFSPDHLVIALGLDTVKGDPTGSWDLSGADLETNGRMIGGSRIPTLVVQEGGYRTRSLGSNARHFFKGLFQGMNSDISMIYSGSPKSKK
ncbi:MAG: histone deacetylase family protein [Candidatus Thermoplasmatota archaeon]|nr:histone deacetylase family protein [Candidatus Thermoplasmatota archaeon]